MYFWIWLNLEYKINTIKTWEFSFYYKYSWPWQSIQTSTVCVTKNDSIRLQLECKLLKWLIHVHSKKHSPVMIKKWNVYSISFNNVPYHFRKKIKYHLKYHSKSKTYWNKLNVDFILLNFRNNNSYHSTYFKN